MIPGPLSALPTLLVEDAVMTLLRHTLNEFNSNLERVWNTWTITDGSTIIRNLPFVEPDRIYITEAIDPLQCPAIFIVPDKTEHNNVSQNFVHQVHSMMVGFLIEDIEATTLARLAWRYVAAGYETYHDKNLGNIHTLVESVDYGPIFRKGKGDGRQFRKDATLRLRVTHLERYY
jgi:hypothetical protein